VNGRLTGHVFQRTWETKDGEERKSWAYAVERGRVDGRRLTPLTRGPFRTQKEAGAALRDELGAREAGTWIEPTRQTVGEWFAQEWVPTLASSRLRATTRDLYARMVRLHIEPKPFGALLIQTLRPRDVSELFDRLAAEGSPGGRGPLGPGSLHNVRTVLHKGLKMAQAEHIVARNVVALVDPPARTQYDDDEEEGEPEHWTPEQVAQFLDYVDAATLDGQIVERRKSRKGTEYVYRRTVAADPMLRAVLYLLAYTGMRRGEACGLRWKHVHLDKGTLDIRGARVMVGGQPQQSGAKTRRGRRSLKLDAEVVAALRTWKAAQNKMRLRWGADWADDGDHVFTHEMWFAKPVRYGVPVRPDWVSAKFRQFRKGAALPALKLHGLRHSYVTTAAEQGVSSRDIADAVGHADVSVTERYYRHTFERVQEVAQAQVANAIRGARGGDA
jgi:integrase